MYEYGNIEDAKPGDVVEWVDTTRHSSHKEHNCHMTLHKLYIVTNLTRSCIQLTNDAGLTKDTWRKSSFKLVKTKPGKIVDVGDTIIYTKLISPELHRAVTIMKPYTVTTKDTTLTSFLDDNNNSKTLGDVGRLVLCKATRTPNEDGNPFKVGDRVRRIANGVGSCPLNSVHTVMEIMHDEVVYKPNYGSHYKNWELVTQLTEWADRIVPTKKRNLAFYKRSGKPWTDEECENVVRYIGNVTQTKNKDWGNVNPTSKYMFDNGDTYNYMANWGSQEHCENFKNCKHIAYEDTFESSVATECSQPTLNTIPEEETMNKSSLILLLEMTAAMNAKEVTDATNAQHIGILTESNGSYVGYVYANTVEELEDVVRKPANEGRTLHVFDYSTTLAQKPRKVIAVART